MDVRVTRGTRLDIVIADEDPDSAATIDFYLDPNDVPLDGNEILLGSGFAEDPDGPADIFSLLIGADVLPGFYRVLAVISDELSLELVLSLGRVEVVANDTVPEPYSAEFSHHRYHRRR